jgi:hypothetical protein
VKQGILVLSVALLAGCASYQMPAATSSSELSAVEPVFEQAAVGEDWIMTNQALKSYREGYVSATRHKAFAQSAVGAWSWKSNRTSATHAIQNALIDCRKNNGRHEADHPCRIINVDGQWSGKR